MTRQLNQLEEWPESKWQDWLDRQYDALIPLMEDRVRPAVYFPLAGEWPLLPVFRRLFEVFPRLWFPFHTEIAPKMDKKAYGPDPQPRMRFLPLTREQVTLLQTTALSDPTVATETKQIPRRGLSWPAYRKLMNDWEERVSANGVFPKRDWPGEDWPGPEQDNPAGKGADEPDSYIIPCLGTNRQGQRLGYGQGYYDEYFGHLKPGTGDRVKIACLSPAQQELNFDGRAEDIRIDLICPVAPFRKE